MAANWRGGMIDIVKAQGEAVERLSLPVIRSEAEAAKCLEDCAGCDEAEPVRGSLPGWRCKIAVQIPRICSQLARVGHCPLGYWDKGKQEPPEPPGLLASGFNLLGSVMQLARDARMVAQDWYESRLQVCQTCEIRTCRACKGTGKRRGRAGRECRRCEGTGRGVTCGSCGCDVRAKLRFRVWKCPEGRFVDVDTLYSGGAERGGLASGSSSRQSNSEK